MDDNTSHTDNKKNEILCLYKTEGKKLRSSEKERQRVEVGSRLRQR
jgi:hypothetical protein